MLKGNIIIGQSGGPTSVINSSLAGVIDAGRKAANVGKILGMRWAIEGFMAGNVVDLSAEPQETVNLLRRTPSSALGSSRHKVKDPDFPVILQRLKEFDIRAIFMAGGNDTMDTIHRVTEYANSHGYEMCGIGIPKTVDNDLFGTDHTPGYASAARYTALSVQQAGRLARDMQKVDQFVIYQSIGRDAGWLSCAAALTRKNPADAPHLIYIPERVFDKAKFLADVKSTHEKYGFVSIVCGEGIKYADGTPVSATKTKDKFGNEEFGAMGGSSVALNLHRMIKDEFGWRGEFQITESLPMSAIDRAVGQDLDEAYACGCKAVELADSGKTGVMVSIVRKSDSPYAVSYETVPLKDVAVKAKPMPDSFINAEGNFPSQAFFDYIRPLVGELDEYAELKYIPAK
ncbi:MAG TPA: diphosphate--fructose-6-phosphate 1-phosphotransferase [Phycisphaerae bacterium]|nr:diphosphate--fructose-6-phosphate 1-phosphotransferase [Phycisphaerae bacterium]HPS52031.1 diphosphate--fructose-6-phosphate 1-phosphotransferase [Phycisphaerae bacterium]